ncbi:MAG TPA: cyclase family protein [Terriglobia bacterium]|nr:cyclase family protein [Terriglobia bacterium]
MTELSSMCQALQNARVVDLSQTLEEHMPNYPTHSKFYHNLWGSYWHGERSLTYQVTMNEHNGTHVDAPAHFIGDAKPDSHVTIDRVPPARLAGRGVRLDCRKFQQGEDVPQSFLSDWEKAHGPLDAGDIVLFNFGWSAHWKLRPNHTPYITDWPGISMEAAEYLLSRKVAAIGVDTLSPDNPAALRRGPIHPVLLEKQILIIENLCNLDQLPDFFLFLALPLKIREGSGSPIRPVAFLLQ